MMLLAQATPQSMEIAGWLLAAFAVAAGVNQIMGVVDRLKGKPLNHELGAQTGDLTRRVEELEKQTIEGVGRRRALYVEISKAREEADRKLTDLEHRTTARFSDMAESIADVPSKVVALLRNTGVIK